MPGGGGSSSSSSATYQYDYRAGADNGSVVAAPSSHLTINATGADAFKLGEKAITENSNVITAAGDIVLSIIDKALTSINKGADATTKSSEAALAFVDQYSRADSAVTLEKIVPWVVGGIVAFTIYQGMK